MRTDRQAQVSKLKSLDRKNRRVCDFAKKSRTHQLFSNDWFYLYIFFTSLCSLESLHHTDALAA